MLDLPCLLCFSAQFSQFCAYLIWPLAVHPPQASDFDYSKRAKPSKWYKSANLRVKTSIKSPIPTKIEHPRYSQGLKWTLWPLLEWDLLGSVICLPIHPDTSDSDTNALLLYWSHQPLGLVISAICVIVPYFSINYASCSMQSSLLQGLEYAKLLLLPCLRIGDSCA